MWFFLWSKLVFAVKNVYLEKMTKIRTKIFRETKFGRKIGPGIFENKFGQSIFQKKIGSNFRGKMQFEPKKKIGKKLN